MTPLHWDAYVFFKLAGIAWVIAAGTAVLKPFKSNFWQRFLLMVFAALCAFFFSKIWYIIQHIFGREEYPFTQWIEVWNDAGSVLYGWILGGCAAVWAGCALLNIPILKALDRLLPHLLIAQLLNRLGCFMAGCCWGKGPCELPWAVLNEAAGGIRVHPVQLYEAVFDLVLLAALWAVFKRRRDGEVTFVYFVGYALGRFVLEYFRGDNLPAWINLTVPQLTSGLIIVSALLIYSKKRA